MKALDWAIADALPAVTIDNANPWFAPIAGTVNGNNEIAFSNLGALHASLDQTTRKRKLSIV
jgi:hypothetical protein